MVQRAFPSETRKGSVPRAPSKLGRKSLMAELMRHLLVTAEFYVPMLSDVQNGLPTQVRYGLEYLLEIGRAYGSDMQTTSALLLAAIWSLPVPWVVSLAPTPSTCKGHTFHGFWVYRG